MSIFGIFIGQAICPRIIAAYSEFDAIARLRRLDPQLRVHAADLDIRSLAPAEVEAYRDFNALVIAEDLEGASW